VLCLLVVGTAGLVVPKVQEMPIHRTLKEQETHTVESSVYTVERMGSEMETESEMEDPEVRAVRFAKASRADRISNPSNPVAIMNTTFGVMEAELFLDKSPITVSNFIDLAKQGFYDGLHFHRVINNFVAQIGCPYSEDPRSKEFEHVGKGGPEPNSTFRNLVTLKDMKRDEEGHIPDECPELSNAHFTLSMANKKKPNSGGSQFFINMINNAQLDCFNTTSPANHPVFGKIIENYGTAVKISQVKTARRSQKPSKNIRMHSITIRNLAVPTRGEKERAERKKTAWQPKTHSF